MSITIKSPEEIAVLRGGGKLLAAILQKIVDAAKPGVSTLDLDRLAEGLIFSSGGRPSFKGYRIRETSVPYPACLCVSINDEVVHSIPRKDKILKEGDVVSLDIGMCYPGKWQMANGKWHEGLYTDMAITVGIGKISQEAERLICATEESLNIGIKAVRSGAKIGDIGYAIQKRLEGDNLGIIRDLAGHGVGYAVHEEPLIPNYGTPGAGPEFVEGMVIAIEPMATLGGWKVKLDDDEWTFRTADGSLAAHFEHTLAVTKNGAEVLTK